MNFLNDLAYPGQEYEGLSEKDKTGVDTVLGAYRSFRGKRRQHIAYVGMPITSGKRLYTVLESEGLRSAGELRKKYGKKAFHDLVVAPNISEGVNLADRLGLSSNFLCIAPSVFESREWSQEAYLSLWYRVIGELAGTHFVPNEWEYSLGAVKEVIFSSLLQWRLIHLGTLKESVGLFGLKNFHHDLPPEEIEAELNAMSKIRVMYEDGTELMIDGALEKCVNAIEYLIGHGFEWREHQKLAWQLMRVPIQSAAVHPWKKFPHDFATNRYRDSSRKLREFTDE